MTGTHVIVNMDPQACRDEVDKFTKGKADVELHWNTSFVPQGATHGTVNMAVVLSCIIFWECSEKDWRSHLFNQKMKLQTNGISS